METLFKDVNITSFGTYLRCHWYVIGTLVLCLWYYVIITCETVGLFMLSKTSLICHIYVNIMSMQLSHYYIWISMCFSCPNFSPFYSSWDVLEALLQDVINMFFGLICLYYVRKVHFSYVKSVTKSGVIKNMSL